MPSSDNKSTPSETCGAILTPFDKLSREIARRDLLDNFDFLPHGSRLYTLDNNWKSSIIVDSFDAYRVDTLTELEGAVADPQIDFILIGKSALISREGIERICQRNALSKVIFKET